jgi:hypothetical protein
MPSFRKQKLFRFVSVGIQPGVGLAGKLKAGLKIEFGPVEHEQGAAKSNQKEERRGRRRSMRRGEEEDQQQEDQQQEQGRRTGVCISNA